MKEIVKYKEQQERQGYVPASMKVINVAAQRVLCQSRNRSMGFVDLGNGGFEEQ